MYVKNVASLTIQQVQEKRTFEAGMKMNMMENTSVKRLQLCLKKVDIFTLANNAVKSYNLALKVAAEKAAVTQSIGMKFNYTF